MLTSTLARLFIVNIIVLYNFNSYFCGEFLLKRQTNIYIMRSMMQLDAEYNNVYLQYFIKT